MLTKTSPDSIAVLALAACSGSSPVRYRTRTLASIACMTPLGFSQNAGLHFRQGLRRTVVGEASEYVFRSGFGKGGLGFEQDALPSVLHDEPQDESASANVHSFSFIVSRKGKDSLKQSEPKTPMFSSRYRYSDEQYREAEFGTL